MIWKGIGPVAISFESGNSSRFFNTAGPVDCKRHYCVPPLTRLDLGEVLRLIDQQKYFVLHAPRQTGKTSCLLALMAYLNQSGNYCCLYANVELGQSAREEVQRGIQAILGEIASRAQIYLKEPFLSEIWQQVLAEYGGDGALNQILTRWAQASPKPIVLLIDEIDSLVGDTLIAVLRQLRAGYDKRPGSFPQSIVLCGVRDVRDYRIHSDRHKAIITGGSAFNIKAKSLRLGNLEQREVESLYAQHTEETGQFFEPSALERIWELTQGQPWLVNALGYEVCFEMQEGQIRSKPITVGQVEEAKENLILRRETHLDQLTDKLREDRVRRVMQPILAGGELPADIPLDDLQYIEDLGIIRRKPSMAIANPIYQEVIPRDLTIVTQDALTYEPAWYIQTDGRLDMAKLLTAFQQFFREHSEAWLERFDYKEAGPQLLIQAFLQRIVNGGGSLIREYGLGRKRTDLLVLWPYGVGVQWVVIELKVVQGSAERTIEAGLEQTWGYLDRSGAEEGHLVVFDRAPGKVWEEKIYLREEVYRGKTIMIWGM